MSVHRQQQLIKGLLNKFDKVESPLESAWGDLLSGQCEAMEHIDPEFGYHPCVMRNEKEMRSHTSSSSWVANQRKFFRGGDMQELAKMCDRKFGWDYVSGLIYELCEERVIAR